MCTFVRLGFGANAAIVERGAHERAEQRMRLQGLRLELRMELAAQEPGMIRELADLDVNAVGSLSGQPQTVLFQNSFVFAIEFVAVAMTLADLTPPVCLTCETVVRQLAGIRPQAHSSAQLIH